MITADKYEELLLQRARLDAEIAAVRSARQSDVIVQIVKLMHEYDITVEAIQMWLETEQGDKRRRRIRPRYWNPQTGETWSGRGKRPRWMAGRDPNEFLLTMLGNEPDPRPVRPAPPLADKE
ncbi:MAG: H-NS histone family protein [Burkholderiales bacterium]|nr:H-NS histone family protein [Burkholderiales bacterium]